MVAGATVAGETGGVRHDLGKGGLGDVVVQAGNEGADGVVEFQPAPFAKQHEACGGEALGVGCDAESVTRGKQLAGGQVGGAGGVFEDEVAFMHDGEETADLLWVAELIVDPGGDVGNGALQPVFHQRFSGLELKRFGIEKTRGPFLHPRGILLTCRGSGLRAPGPQRSPNS